MISFCQAKKNKTRRKAEKNGGVPLFLPENERFTASLLSA
ncbi:hypothetical protein GTCCBUS3UF5_27320 [Geobacillus thermoleovorans CCB_US3_UF5]|uniref:Uncharacterized protein n=1 Tax=Geobacillus thermoleovorans CCB_US3_UF5 TaxID=1111068 RepID=A0ABM5MJV4_GEOTH|nr:hypothetical protein GTCCBUS3UF5_27320 [Geobacillus thermoleovorans CCB_US3_UF5]